MPVRSAARSGRWPGMTPNSPATLGAVTSSTTASRARPLGVTISSWILLDGISVAISALLCELASARLHVLDVPLQVERLLRELLVVVELAGDDLLEALDGLLELHELALEAGELRGDEERLREEALDL